MPRFQVTFKGGLFDITVSGDSSREVVENYRVLEKEIAELLGLKLVAKNGRRTHESRPNPITTATFAEMDIEPPLRDRILANIRSVSYWDLVLAILYHSKKSLTYDDLMSASNDVRKPISYDWLNTEFQRKKYRGLVRSEAIPGSKKKAYSITELGRRRAESFFTKLSSDQKTG